MAELTYRERLQPSLLDRLTDNHRDKKTESGDERVMTMAQLRAVVIRDLAWLLNTPNLAAYEDLTDYDEVRCSVLNYGVRGLTGTSSSGLDVKQLQDVIRKAIQDFEPRILHESVRVRATVAADMGNHALVFSIDATLWAQPAPLRLYLRTTVDLEDGSVVVSESAGQSR
ncbi:MAG: type VI secretion system baseplate subunit TssE [Planctomycetes bacterium]|nr:type VI secretion system baseplate subunit TssE [Planctomycetota bacterium]